MSDTKFTPGPWWVDCHNKNVFITDSENNTAVCKIMHLRPDGADNAHLIAAAPELYYSAKELCDILENADIPTYVFMSLVGAIDKVERSLAKARGEV